MKFVIPALLSLALGWNWGTSRILASDEPVPQTTAGPFRPTVTAKKDGQPDGRYQYRKNFDTLKECQDYVSSLEDPEYKQATFQLFQTLVKEGVETAIVTCEEDIHKPSI